MSTPRARIPKMGEEPADGDEHAEGVKYDGVNEHLYDGGGDYMDEVLPSSNEELNLL